jgi:hypothetical protein
MIYTAERVHSRVTREGRALFRLTYESTFIQELNLWRHFLVAKEEVGSVSADMPELLSPTPAPDQR